MLGKAFAGGLLRVFVATSLTARRRSGYFNAIRRYRRQRRQPPRGCSTRVTLNSYLPSGDGRMA
ncbi:MAG: hypothetical protein ACYDEY_15595, partial [Acidimicrobiales bacterium]